MPTSQKIKEILCQRLLLIIIALRHRMFPFLNYLLCIHFDYPKLNLWIFVDNFFFLIFVVLGVNTVVIDNLLTAMIVVIALMIHLIHNKRKTQTNVM